LRLQATGARRSATPRRSLRRRRRHVYAGPVSIAAARTLKASLQDRHERQPGRLRAYTITAPVHVVAPGSRRRAGTYTSAQTVTISTRARRSPSATPPTARFRRRRRIVYSGRSAVNTRRRSGHRYAAGMTDSASLRDLFDPAPVAAPASPDRRHTRALSRDIPRPLAVIRYTTTDPIRTSTIGIVYSARSRSTDDRLRPSLTRRHDRQRRLLRDLLILLRSRPRLLPTGGNYTSAQSVTSPPRPPARPSDTPPTDPIRHRPSASSTPARSRSTRRRRSGPCLRRRHDDSAVSSATYTIAAVAIRSSRLLPALCNRLGDDFTPTSAPSSATPRTDGSFVVARNVYAGRSRCPRRRPCAPSPIRRASRQRRHDRRYTSPRRREPADRNYYNGELRHARRYANRSE